MDRRRRKRLEPRRGAPSAAAEQPVVLPVWKAFVVQFTEDTSSAGPIFAGRVEHLNSGTRVRFGSAQGLTAALRRLLGQTEPRLDESDDS